MPPCMPLGLHADHETVVALQPADGEELLDFVQHDALLLQHGLGLWVLRDVAHVGAQPGCNSPPPPLHDRSQEGAEIHVENDEVLLRDGCSREILPEGRHECHQIRLDVLLHSTVISLHTCWIS